MALERLTSADTYAICTVLPDGRPHVVPVISVWFIVVEGDFQRAQDGHAAALRQ